MSAKRRGNEPSGVLTVAEEAVLLVRRAPFAAWACYFAASVPFVLGLLYFWSDMSRGARAHDRCVPAALGLAALFVVMKIGQALFVAHLLDTLSQRLRPWTVRRLLRLVAVQGAIQSWGLFVMPLALLLVYPFVFMHGYYQHWTAIGDGEGMNLKQLRRRAWALAKQDMRTQAFTLWLLSPWLLGLGMLLTFGAVRMMALIVPVTEVHTAIWFVMGTILFAVFTGLISPLGLALTFNIGILFMTIPELLRVFMGWDTIFRISGGYALANTTFLAALFGIAYLCMDPIMKAAYAIRTFQSESLRNGRDILVAIHDLRDAREAAS